MVCIILKTYSPVHVPETLALQQFHFILPGLLYLQNSFEAAVKLLQDARVEKEIEGLLREIAGQGFVPGVRNSGLGQQIRHSVSLGTTEIRETQWIKGLISRLKAPIIIKSANCNP